MAESTQHKLDRVRPPRVQITYDVEVGGAIQKKELPLVVGILSDLSGATPNPTALKERKFVEIDRDNFNEVMKQIKPSLKLSVPNKLVKDSESNLPVALTFEKLDDFTPASLVKQIEGLQKLLTARQRLNDLLAKLDGNDALNAQLLQLSAQPETMKQLQEDNAAALASAAPEKTNG